MRSNIFPATGIILIVCSSISCERMAPQENSRSARGLIAAVRETTSVETPAAEAPVVTGTVALATELASELVVDLLGAGLSNEQALVIADSSKQEVSQTAGTLVISTLALIQGTSTIEQVAPPFVAGAIKALDDPAVGLAASEYRAAIAKVVMSSTFKSLGGRVKALSGDQVMDMQEDMVGAAVTSLQAGGLGGDAADQALLAVTSGAVEALPNTFAASDAANAASFVIKGAIAKLALSGLPMEHLEDLVGAATEGAVAGLGKNQVPDLAGAVSKIAHASVASIKHLGVGAEQAKLASEGAAMGAVAGFGTAGVSAANMAEAAKSVAKASVTALADVGLTGEDLTGAVAAVTSGAIQGLMHGSYTGAQIADNDAVAEIISGAAGAMASAGVQTEAMSGALSNMAYHAVSAIGKAAIGGDDGEIKSKVLSSVITGSASGLAGMGMSGADAMSALGAVSQKAVASMATQNFGSAVAAQASAMMVGKGISAAMAAGIATSDQMLNLAESLGSAIGAGCAEAKIVIDSQLMLEQVSAAASSAGVAAVDMDDMLTAAVRGTANGAAIIGGEGQTAIMNNLQTTASDTTMLASLGAAIDSTALSTSMQGAVQTANELASVVGDQGLSACGSIYPDSMSDAQFWTAWQSATKPVVCQGSSSRCPAPRNSAAASGSWTAVGTTGVCQFMIAESARDSTTTTTTSSDTQASSATDTATSTDVVVNNDDRTTPTVTISAPASATVYNAGVSSITVQGSCSHDGASVLISGGVSGSAVCSTNTYTANVSLAGAVDGTLVITVAHTAAGVAASPASVTVLRDATLPTLTITTVSPGSSISAATASAITISGSCSENGRTVQISGPVSASASCTGGSFASTLDLSSASEGTLTVTASLSDAAGNSASTTSTLFKDSVAPTVSITSPANSSYINASNFNAVAVAGTCSEPGQTVFISGAASGSANCVSGTWSVNLNFSSVADGSRSISAQITDSVGNAGAPASLNLIMDTVAPVVSAGTDHPHGASTYTQTGSASGAASLTWSVVSGPGSVVFGSVSSTATTVTASADGVYILRLTAQDAAGNSAFDDVQVTWRDLPGISGVPTTIVANAAATLTAAGTGAGSFSYAWTGPGGLTFGTPNAATTTVMSSSPGALTAVITVTDDLGLQASQNVTVIHSPSTIAAGNTHSCALKQDGSIKCWGDNSFGQLGDGSGASSFSPVLVTGITGAVAVVAGLYHSCALMGDQTVKCWGKNAAGQLGDNSTTHRSSPVAVGSLSGVTSLAAGANHTCAVTSGGAAYCWGENTNGKLGDGGQTNQLVPTAVSGVSAAIAISAGDQHTCVLNSDSTVACWGYNASGQLGDNTTTQRDTATTTVYADSGAATALTGVVALSAGANFTCALMSDQTGKCWGMNNTSQLGNGGSTQSNVPVTVTGLTGAMQIEAGGNHACALLSSGAAKCWGYGGWAQIGDGYTDVRTTPTSVSGFGSGVVGVSAGSSHSCAMLASGTAKCWGSNTTGQLGIGRNSNNLSPTTVDGSNAFTQVSPGKYFSCGRLTTGDIKCWGVNTQGPLGNGSTLASGTPVAASISGAASVSSGDQHSCALMNDGSVMCWGINSNGQLGDNSTNSRDTPVAVVGLGAGAASKVVVGSQHSCAILSDQTVKCWGKNTNGQLGDTSTTQRNTPAAVGGSLSGVTDIALGLSHTCAVASGAVYCWGLNTDSQIGDGTIIQRTIPTATGTLGGTAVAVAAGYNHSCAVLGSGSIKCWGDGAYYQLGDGNAIDRSTPYAVSGISTAADVAVGQLHSCALLTDNSVKCWGTNSNGQLGTGNSSTLTSPTTVSGLASVSSLAISNKTTCVTLSGDDSAQCWGDNTFYQVGDGYNSSVPNTVTSFSF